jgi:hypothetical protein
VLARVIVKLGDLPTIDTRIIEGLFASDLDHLQRLYERINGDSEAAATTEPISIPMNGELTGARGFRAVGEA